MRELRKSSEYREVYKRGDKIAGRLVVLFVLEHTGRDITRVGISVTRRIRKATDRNKLKRRCREILRAIDLNKGAQCDIVVNIHQEALYARFDELEKETSLLLEKAVGVHHG